MVSAIAHAAVLDIAAPLTISPFVPSVMECSHLAVPLPDTDRLLLLPLLRWKAEESLPVLSLRSSPGVRENVEVSTISVKPSLE